jgi:hypothetical protein
VGICNHDAGELQAMSVRLVKLEQRMVEMAELLERQHRAIGELIEYVDAQNTRWEQMDTRTGLMWECVMNISTYLIDKANRERPLIMMQPLHETQ